MKHFYLILFSFFLYSANTLADEGVSSNDSAVIILSCKNCKDSVPVQLIITKGYPDFVNDVKKIYVKGRDVYKKIHFKDYCSFQINYRAKFQLSAAYGLVVKNDSLKISMEMMGNHLLQYYFSGESEIFCNVLNNPSFSVNWTRHPSSQKGLQMAFCKIDSITQNTLDFLDTLNLSASQKWFYDYASNRLLISSGLAKLKLLNLYNTNKPQKYYLTPGLLIWFSNIDLNSRYGLKNPEYYTFLNMYFSLLINGNNYDGVNSLLFSNFEQTLPVVKDVLKSPNYEYYMVYTLRYFYINSVYKKEIDQIINDINPLIKAKPLLELIKKQ
jgi:hypothetical protein